MLCLPGNERSKILFSARARGSDLETAAAKAAHTDLLDSFEPAAKALSESRAL
jgi:hypothetical protein